MSSTVRTSVDSAPETPQETQTDGSSVNEVTVDPPFTSYEKDKGKPFIVDHYELGRFWNDGDMYTNGYVGEVDTISTYLTHLVNTGEISNTLEAAKDKLKSIEKMVGVKDDARTAVKVGQVAAYIEFLLKSDNIKKESAKYGLI